MKSSIRRKDRRWLASAWRRFATSRRTLPIRRRRCDAARDAGRTSADDRIRLLAERPIPARVRPGRLQRRRARPPCVRRAHDLCSAGAGGGSFNHRFAMPGVAGNSVLSVLRPVDLPPFTDEGLLALARAARVTPKIFYTFSSTDTGRARDPHAYDERAAGRDAPLATTSRLYFLAGTPHSSGQLSLVKGPRGSPYSALHQLRPAALGLRARSSSISTRGRANKSEPPSSQYPSVEKASWLRSKTSIFQRCRRFRSPHTCRKCGGWTTDRNTPRRRSSRSTRRELKCPI